MQKSESVHTREGFLHRCHMDLEPFVYSYLRNTYGKALSKHWSSCTIPRESTKGIVIVERRCHPNLEFILHNAVYFAPGYSVHVICSEANAQFVKETCGSQLESIHIHPVYSDIGTQESGKKEYNMLLKMYGFWSFFSEEWLLCMEMDSYLLRHLPPEIYNYSYIGSKWPWLPNEPGGGGITHRKRSFMLEVTTIDSLQHLDMQDTVASQGLVLLGLPIMEGNLFGEVLIDYNTIGTHQWWTFSSVISKENMPAYLNIVLTLHLDKT